MDSSNSLEARIAQVISGASKLSASSVAALVAETKTALKAAETEAHRAEQVALDPALAFEKAEQARLDLDKARFRARRLAVAFDRLGQLEGECQLAEAEAVRLSKYAAARDLRDECSALIRRDYPAIQASLMQLIAKIAAASRAVEAANSDLPPGAKALDRPEGAAFGYPDSPHKRVVGARAPEIAEMLIPDFDNWNQPVWPPNWHRGVSGRPMAQEIASWLAAFDQTGKAK